MMMGLKEERKLNAFEAFFAACNIRFALMVVIQVPTTAVVGSSEDSMIGEDGNDQSSSSSSSSSQLLQKLKDGTIHAIQSSRLGHLQLVHKKEEEGATGTPNKDDDDDDAEGFWYMAEYHPGKGPEGVIVPQCDICRTVSINDDYGRYLDDCVHNTDPASSKGGGEGPLHVELLRFIDVEDENISRHTNSEQRDETVAAIPSTTALGLYVNGNHALCDGRSLLHFVSMALQQEQVVPSGSILSKKSTLDGNSDSSSSISIVPQDWKDLVQESVSALQDWNDVPSFLGTSSSLISLHDDTTVGQELLTMHELSSNHVSSKKLESPSVDGDMVSMNQTIRFETPSDVMRNFTALLHQLKKEEQREISLTGLLVAIIMKSIATEYYEGNNDQDGQESVPASRVIGVSVLVDLRPYLKNQTIVELPQAIGTVTLLLSTDEFLLESEQDGSLRSLLLHRAEKLTIQLKQRIQRGEAHRSALALTNGNFEGSSPPATLELSNLGVCSLPTSTTKLFTAQRFDGCDSVSCVVHSEISPSSTNSSENGTTRTNTVMRWCVSIGDGQNEGLVERIFSRAVTQMGAIANSVCS